MRATGRFVARLALLLAVADTGEADAVTASGSLGDAASEVDYYQVSCWNDGSGAPASLAFQVLDAGPVAAALVNLQAQKSVPPVGENIPQPWLAANATDPGDGDASPSPLAWVNGGPGSYDLFVDKTAAGAEGYQLTVECRTGFAGGGAATGTTLTPIVTGEAAVPALSPPGALALAAGLGLLGAAALRRRTARGVALVALFVAAGRPVDAGAHTQAGLLGSGAPNTDFYQVLCTDDGTGPPVSLLVQVFDENPVAAPLVAAQVQKDSLVANTTDPTDGNATPGSPMVALNGGGGTYEVLVYKTAAGSEEYSLVVHCMTGPDGTGDHTGTLVITKQSQ
jgi:hypothetical protein